MMLPPDLKSGAVHLYFVISKASRFCVFFKKEILHFIYLSCLLKMKSDIWSSKTLSTSGVHYSPMKFTGFIFICPQI